MKRKGPITKQRRAASKLRRSHPYLLCAGLRGPDVSGSVGHHLKSTVTGRLRAIAFSRKDCGGCWNDTPLTGAEIRRMREVLAGPQPDGLWHFLVHLYDAVMATSNHPIWGGHETALLALLSLKGETT